MLRALAGGIFLLMLIVAAAKYSGGEKKSLEPAAGTIWTEATTGMQFVWVPSGCFNMGSDKSRDDQKPVHEVCLKGFHLGKYEVTQAEYEKIVGKNPCAVKCNNYLGPDRAVVNLFREDAEYLAEKFGALTANRFRLPSESEWEYACQAGGKHKEYCGDGDLKDVAWMGVTHTGHSPLAGKNPTPGGCSTWWVMPMSTCRIAGMGTTSAHQTMGVPGLTAGTVMLGYLEGGQHSRTIVLMPNFVCASRET